MNKKIICTVLFSSFLFSCRDDSKSIEPYKSPTCEAGQYFDGKLGSCRANIEALEFPATFRSKDGEHAFLNEPFLQGPKKVEEFLQAYADSYLPDYTLSNLACTPGYEKGALYDTKAYDGRFSINCGLKLVKNGKAIISYNYDETKADSKYIKILLPSEDSPISLKLCKIGKTKQKKMVLKKEILEVEESELLTTVNCKNFGSSATLNTAIESDDANLEALPRTLYKYLSNEQTEAYVDEGLTLLEYASDLTDQITVLSLNCGDEQFDLSVSLRPDVNTTVSGTLAITNFNYAQFFTVKEYKDKDGKKFKGTRSLLGCSTKKCLEDKSKNRIPYRFFGNNIIVDGKDSWSIQTEDGVETSYLAKLADGKDLVCAYNFTAI